MIMSIYDNEYIPMLMIICDNEYIPMLMSISIWICPFHVTQEHMKGLDHFI